MPQQPTGRLRCSVHILIEQNRLYLHTIYIDSMHHGVILLSKHFTMPRDLWQYKSDILTAPSESASATSSEHPIIYSVIENSHLSTCSLTMCLHGFYYR